MDKDVNHVQLVERFLSTYSRFKQEIGKAKNINKICRICRIEGVRCLKDFSEDEKKVIVDQCTKELLGPNVLSEKYNTIPLAIKHFVRYGNSGYGNL